MMRPPFDFTQKDAIAVVGIGATVWYAEKILKKFLKQKKVSRNNKGLTGASDSLDSIGKDIEKLRGDVDMVRTITKGYPPHRQQCMACTSMKVEGGGMCGECRDVLQKDWNTFTCEWCDEVYYRVEDKRDCEFGHRQDDEKKILEGQWKKFNAPPKTVNDLYRDTYVGKTSPPARPVKQIVAEDKQVEVKIDIGDSVVSNSPITVNVYQNAKEPKKDQDEE